MPKLHELLAIEKGKLSQWTTLVQDTLAKFGKEQYFKGFIKNLKMIRESPENEALEKSGTDSRDVITTVGETLEYLFETWADYEDTQFRKNLTNQKASASFMIGDVLIEDVPVDELMGLESRLAKIREIFHQAPTLDASREWLPSTVRTGVWIAAKPDVTTKTEKAIVPVVLYEATKEHPAKVETVNKEEVVGTYTTVTFSGAARSLQKANALKRIDDLLIEIKKARMRANMKEVVNAEIGKTIVKYLLEPFQK